MSSSGSRVNEGSDPGMGRRWACGVPRLSLVAADVALGPVTAAATRIRVGADIRVVALVPVPSPRPRGRLAVVVDGPGTVVLTDEGLAGVVQGRSLLGSVPVAGATAVALRVPWRHVCEWRGTPDDAEGASTIEVLGTDPPFAVTLRGARFPPAGPSGMLER